MKYCSLFILAFVLLMCSCESKSYKSVDFAEFGGIDLVTYQIPGDKPHQYIRFGYNGYAGAHYPECKYCKENKDTINGD